MPEGNYFAPERTRIFFVRVGLGETKLEILLPDDAESGIGRYLDRRGPGLHHIGYGSDDVIADTKQFIDNGLRYIDFGEPIEDITASFLPPQLGQRHPHRDRPRPKAEPLIEVGCTRRAARRR